MFSALVLSAVVASSTASAPATLDLLRNWLDLVERHVPGEYDPALNIAGEWSNEDVTALRDQVGALIIVLRNPALRRIRSLSGLTIEGATLDELRRIADAIRAGGTKFLQRAVLFHTDIVTMDVARPETETGRDSSSRFTVRVGDGRLTGFSEFPAHWDLARVFADYINKPPDPWVLRWYQATCAFLIRDRYYSTEQLRAAVRVFPNDPQVLMFAAAEREALSSPEVQSFVQLQARAANITVPVGSVNKELSEAERLLARALESDPGLVEARIRLARVLGLLGRHPEALRHLRIALPEIAEPRLEYYAQLFLGNSLHESNDIAGARDAYQRAASLFPGAQTPNLALAFLARQTGDRAQVAARLDAALSGDVDEPWTAYVAAGRNAEAMLRAVRLGALVR